MRLCHAILAAAAVLLSACSQSAPPDARAEPGRAQSGQVTGPLLLADSKALDAPVMLVQQGRNGDAVTWHTGDRVALTFKDGVLVATRGLGADLMTADVNNTRAMLTGRAMPAFYTRFHSHLDGTVETRFRSFQCEVAGREPETIKIGGRARDVTRIEERCLSPGLEVRNEFWRGADGTLWKTRQWVNEDSGYLMTQRLLR